MLNQFGFLALLPILLFSACTTTKTGDDGETERSLPDGVNPADVKPADASERDERLNEAVAFIKGAKVGQGLEILYGLAQRYQKDDQVLYILGRTLYEQASYRAARTELKKVVEINPKHSLAWQKLGDIYQRLGEHSEAIAAFTQVASLVPTTIDPLRCIAANYWLRGQPQRALGALKQARARLADSKREDVLLEYLAAKVHLELGNQQATATAARAFLRLSKGKPDYAEDRQFYTRWLKVTNMSLSDEDVSSLLSYGRSTLNKVVEGKRRPDLIARKASKRLFAFDQTSIFVTLIPSGGLGQRLTGRGRGKNLLSSLSRALDVIMTHPAYNKELCRRAAIRLSLLTGDIEAAAIAPARSAVGQRSKKAIELGRYGVAIDAGNNQPFALPGDATSEDLRSVEELLAFACRKSRLQPQAWTQRPLFRFTTNDYVQSSPGARIVLLEHGEPLPYPAPESSRLWQAAREAGNWLLKNQQPNGIFGQTYRPRFDRFQSDKRPGLEMIQVEDIVAISVRATPTVSTSTGFEIRANCFLVAHPKATRTALKEHLDAYFMLSDKETKLSQGDIKGALSYRIKGRRSESLRLMFEAAAGRYDLAAHGRAVLALAKLHERTSAPNYLKGALKAAHWARARYQTISKQQRRRALLSMLAMYTALDSSLNSEGEAPQFGKIRKELAAAALAQLKKSISAPDSTSTTSSFQVGEALLALANHALQARQSALFSQLRDLSKVHIGNWKKAMRSRREPRDAYFAEALFVLYRQYKDEQMRDFILEIGLAISAQIHDPATHKRTAGAVALTGLSTVPTSLETALANRAFIVLTRLCAMNRSDDSFKRLEGQYRLAAISAAAFQLRHQIRAEHSYFLPNIERATGSFRVGLYRCEVTLDSMQLNIGSFLDNVQLIRDAKENGKDR
jgi:tetratricopeptide (TPR) repeat protein